MKIPYSLGAFGKDQQIYYIPINCPLSIVKCFFWDFADYRYRELGLFPDFYVKIIDGKYCIGYADTAAEVIRYSFGLYETHEEASQALADLKYSLILAHSDDKLRRNFENLEYYERHFYDVRARVYESYEDAKEVVDKLKKLEARKNENLWDR